MSKYIIVRTFCDKEEIADKIIDVLLEKKLVAGTQKSIIYSKYWWNKELEDCNEYKLEFRTRIEKFDEIKEEILKIHDYDVCEISYTVIDDANKEFLEWIDDSIGMRESILV